jgi:hypothetical protein
MADSSHTTTARRVDMGAVVVQIYLLLCVRCIDYRSFGFLWVLCLYLFINEYLLDRSELPFLDSL